MFNIHAISFEKIMRSKKMIWSGAMELIKEFTVQIIFLLFYLLLGYFSLFESYHVTLRLRVLYLFIDFVFGHHQV